MFSGDFSLYIFRWNPIKEMSTELMDLPNGIKMWGGEQKENNNQSHGHITGEKGTFHCTLSW